MSHSPHHIPHEICFVLESANGVTGREEVFLRVDTSQGECEWMRVLSPLFPLHEPLGCYYLFSREEGSVVDKLEVRIDFSENSYGATIALSGEMKTRGRVQLYNENDPSHVILITLAVLIRVLPLTPREYQEATTQTHVRKGMERWTQTLLESRNAVTATSPLPEDTVMEEEEERRRQMTEILEETIKRRLMGNEPLIDSGHKSLSDEVTEMRRSLRLLGKEERNRREKGANPPNKPTTIPLTPPDSPSSSSSTESVSSSSSTTTSSQQSLKPNLSPTSAYIQNLREKIVAERKLMTE